MTGDQSMTNTELSVSKSKRVRVQLNAVVSVLFVVVTYTAAVAQPPRRLTPEQEALAQRIDGMLIAPCCFANTVAEHRSPISDEIRDHIRVAVASGAAENEILNAFVGKYGERILAAPKPQGFNLLAYVLPAVVLAVGLLLIAFTLHRHRPQRVEPNTVPPEQFPEQLKARFEAEMAQFDG
jgi:cytochrome c-type biogenesis protein CcmH